MSLHICLTQEEPYQEVLDEKIEILQKQLNLTGRDRFEINLIMDELCTNIFASNSGKADLQVTIEVRWKNHELTMVFNDNGIPFDPTSVPPPDTTLPLSKREAGGLGLFFVKKYSQTFTYSRVNDCNQSIVQKRLENIPQ